MNKKIMRFESKRDQKKKEKKGKKGHFVSLRKAYFSSCYFFTNLSPCTSKMISRAWGRVPITF